MKADKPAREMTVVKHCRPAVFVLFVVLAAAGFASCRKRPAPYPHAIVPGTAYDFRQVNAGDKITHDFTISNDGGKPLLIQGILSTCRCIFARVSNREVLPGGKSVLTVRLDTTGLSGPIDSKILLYTNASNERVITFKIKASVNRLYSLEPATVDFGNITGNGARSQTVVFTSTSMGITSATPASPYLKTHLSSRGPHAFAVTITLDKGQPAGLFKSTVFIHTTSPIRPVVQVRVKADKISDMRANPDHIFAGILLKDRESAVFSTYIFTKHRKPFAIKEISDTNNYLHIHAERFAPDVYKVDVRVKPFTHTGEYTSDIMIATTDKTTPLLRIPFRVLVMDRD